MKKQKLVWTNFILIILLYFSSYSISLADNNHSRIWVVYHSGHGEKAGKALTQAGAKIHHQFNNLNAYAVTVPAAAIKGLSQNPSIELIEEDAKRYPSSQVTPYGIDSVQAREVWDANRDNTIDINAPTGQGIKICIIDSGLYINHEEFSGVNISGSNDPVSGSWNIDKCGHGTHVAGTIVAANNDKGVVGVSPGKVSLHIIKVFGKDNIEGCGWAYSSDLVAATKKCRDAGANIISMSLGGSAKVRTEENAFKDLYNNQNILSMAAAGNDGNNRSSYPASYKTVISIAAIDVNNVIADFSQQNSQVELAAPGVGILSTVPWVSTNTLTVNATEYLGNKIEYAAETTGVSGDLIDGGLCDTQNSSWSGQLVLCERGDISFFDKVQNVQDSGGIAAIIYNNVSGSFSGTLGDGNSSTIPAISLSQEDGNILTSSSLGDSGTVISFKASGNGYEAKNGTSMATPHVSAVAALVWSSDLTKTNQEVHDALTATAMDLGDAGRDNAYGYGLVQADDAWQYLGGSNSTPSNNPPIASFSFSCDNLTLTCDFDGSNSSDSDGTIASYDWDFDDATATGITPSHTYTAAGNFTVTLTVTDDAGDSNISSQDVQIIDASGDVTPPVISNISSTKLKGTSFKITWTTDELAYSEVNLTCCGTFSNSTLTTSHSMSFRGSKGALYEYSVSSTDAAGNTSTDGSYTHQN